MQDRPGDVAMAVLADDPDPRADRSGRFEQGRAGGVELAHQPRHVAAGRPESLGIVIEMRQIDERQVGPFAVEDIGRGPGDPLRCKAGPRPAPRRCGRETCPVRVSSRSVRPSGVPVMPKTLLPSAP